MIPLTVIVSDRAETRSTRLGAQPRVRSGIAGASHNDTEMTSPIGRGHANRPMDQPHPEHTPKYI